MTMPQDGQTPQTSAASQPEATAEQPPRQANPSLPPKTPAAPPGNLGASPLHHVRATAFFLDYAQHITLSTEQQKTLNQIKEQATLSQVSASREAREAGRQLWHLTDADQADGAKTETTVREIAKLRADQRPGFIQAVAPASQVLTKGQRQALLGDARRVARQ